MKNVSILLLITLSGLFAEEIKTDSTEQIATPELVVSNIDSSWQLVSGTDSLRFRIVKAGAGEQVQAGDLVEVNYRGWLDDGTEFDNSAPRGPLEFALGAGKVILGWDKAIAGMKVGERRELLIPAEFGYGSQDLGVIPPESRLNFSVELLRYQKGLAGDTLKVITKWETISRGVQAYTELEGFGQGAQIGDKVKLHYTGWLSGGTKFATSKDTPVPSSFVLGKNEVIAGWELGLKGVKKGEVRWLNIPPQMGYGGVPLANVPANSTLLFRVEIDGIEFSQIKSDMPKLEDLPWQELRANIKYFITQSGTGDSLQIGQKVGMHYTGWLLDGTKFDSSRPRNQVFEFQLGAKQVIPGWELGIDGMQVGEKRMLWIPSYLGYGPNGAGQIPPNADLVFEVERVQ